MPVEDIKWMVIILTEFSPTVYDFKTEDEAKEFYNYKRYDDDINTVSVHLAKIKESHIPKED
jgi:hypothetical protein